MNFLSLKVRGIRSKGKAGWVKGLKSSHGVDFLAVQESKIMDPSVWLLPKCWGNSTFLFDCVNSDGIAGGLICWWDPSCFRQTGVIKSHHVLVISGDMVHSGFHVNIANVHAPNDAAGRRNFWNELLFYRRSLFGLRIFLGDFNLVRSIDERVNSDFLAQNALSFNSFIADADLFEYNMCGHKYTYMSSNGEKLSKLDRSLVCNDFMSNWPSAELTTLSRHLSDHCPLLLSIKNSDYGHIPFRFYDSWLQLPGFVDFVNSIANNFVFDGPADIALAADGQFVGQPLSGINDIKITHLIG
ncbi:uncharacterized protein LOC110933902 [Helianthus annuus]|uniref:uncharacterized protein LOC110933902 n=1 Tax=Helianthus annuus TaxID=4232 RepID=UPI000B8EF6A5|nr:uncharacterized protein LOC110933902 [Helianthus annuus]